MDIKRRHFTLLFLFFLTGVVIVLSMTQIDFIVHNVLYQYGLNFSMEWASSYWTMLGSVFILVSALIVITYLMGVQEINKRSLSTGLLLGFSVYVLGVNLDLLWFTAFLRELPALSEHWWWMPMDGFLGVKWTTLHQILYTLAFNVALIGLWVSKFMGFKSEASLLKIEVLS